MKRLQGTISISRPSYGDGRLGISIRLIDGKSHTEFVDIEMSLEAFAAAVTGLSSQPMEFEWRPTYVGMTYQNKEVMVPFDGPYTNDDSERKALAVMAFKDFEVDGWRGDVTDLFNHHRKTKDGYRVRFWRYVEAE